MCPTYTSAVLDPRITYKGLKLDFANNPGLLTDLERSKELLEEFYDNNYAMSSMHSENFDDSHPIDHHMLDFTSRYSSIDAEVVNELEEYFKTKHKDFKKCNSLRWQRSQCKDWPNLYCLIYDILYISGL